MGILEEILRRQMGYQGSINSPTTGIQPPMGAMDPTPPGFGGGGQTPLFPEMNVSSAPEYDTWGDFTGAMGKGGPAIADDPVYWKTGTEV